MRDFPKQTLDLINETWKKPSSTKLCFLIDILNRSDQKTYEKNGAGKLAQCRRCGLRAPATTEHRLLTCPAVADIWNEAEKCIWNLITPETCTYPVNSISLRAENYTQSISLPKARQGLRPGHLIQATGTSTLAPGPPMPIDTSLEEKIASMLAITEAANTTLLTKSTAERYAHQAKLNAEQAKLFFKETIETARRIHETYAEALAHLDQKITTECNRIGFITSPNRIEIADLPPGEFVAIMGTPQPLEGDTNLTPPPQSW